MTRAMFDFVFGSGEVYMHSGRFALLSYSLSVERLQHARRRSTLTALTPCIMWQASIRYARLNGP